MDFVLKIFFSGLIALLPSADGKELTVLLLNTPHEYAMADGSRLAHHRAMVLARAASCEGACITDDQASIAQFMFPNKTPVQAATALDAAVLGGGAWQLSSSDLSLIGPTEPLALRTGVRARDRSGSLQPVPTTAAEREDFTWVADLAQIVPGSGGFKAAVTGSAPPPGNLIAARLKLRSGRVFTYSLVKIDGKARPVHFRKPSGEGPDAPYAQAVANWVEAEIHVPGDVVEIVDRSFPDPDRRRSMKLHPLNGLVELAMLNLPPLTPPSPGVAPPLPRPGQHFQIYYELVKTPPGLAERLVPHLALSPSASDAQVDWASLHPRQKLWSDLLEHLGLSPRGKGPYDLALCPIVRD
jgi:hypothetical protein